MDRKGIVTIVGLVMFVILLIMFSMFVPILMQTISEAKTCLTDPLSSMMLDLIPLMILLGIVISWFIYAGAVR